MAAPGAPAPEALLHGSLTVQSQKDQASPWHLTSRWGKGLVALVFNPPELSNPLPVLAAQGIEFITITPANDTSGQAWQRYGLPDVQAQGLVLIRPDGYVMGRWRALDAQSVLNALQAQGVTR